MRTNEEAPAKGQGHLEWHSKTCICVLVACHVKKDGHTSHVSMPCNVGALLCHAQAIRTWHQFLQSIVDKTRRHQTELSLEGWTGQEWATQPSSSQDEDMVKTGQGQAHQAQAKPGGQARDTTLTPKQPSQEPQVKRQITPTTFSIDQRTLHPIQCMHLWTDRHQPTTRQGKKRHAVSVSPKALQPTKLDTSTGSPATESSTASPTEHNDHSAQPRHTRQKSTRPIGKAR
jgi:hypothetical protein